jgi:hypothetical protein
VSKVVLQPAGGSAAMQHFDKTILRGVSMPTVTPFISPLDVRSLEAAYPDDIARAWGVTPGEALRNKKKWVKLEPSDVVLFCGHGEAFAYGYLILKLRSRPLAEMLWGRDRHGQTWEFMYFVSRPFTHSIPYFKLAKAAGYAANYVVLGFTVLDQPRSRRVIEAFGLAPA